MDVLVLASQKGGGGKTTISGHLAVEAQRNGGGPVAMIDTDPQGSLSDWWNSREDEQPILADAPLKALAQKLGVLRDNGIRLVVIDTPPALGAAIAAVVNLASLVLIPTRPSPHDIRAIRRTTELVEQAGKNMVFVVNGGTVRARMTGETAMALSQFGTVAPVVLHHRIDFASSMMTGLTVGEANPASPSAREVAELWIYVNERLRKVSVKQKGVRVNG